MCSTILKLYEKVVLTFIHVDGDIRPNAKQGGFQKHVNCLMTAFALRGSVQFARENSARVYASNMLEYCNTWGLEVNLSTTNIMVSRTRGRNMDL